MVIDTEFLFVSIKSPQFAQEGQVLLGILRDELSRVTLGVLTFCEYWAIMRTNWKLYMPRATSYSWSTSERKMMYLMASSTISGWSP